MSQMTDTGSGPTVGNQPHPRQWDGLRVGMQEIASRIRVAGRRHDVIARASQIIQAAGLPVERGKIDPTATVEALYNEQRKKIAFVRDPINTERMASTAQLWCIEGESCVPAGDCDDQVIALGGMCVALGIRVRVVTRFYPPAAQTHTTMEYDASPTYDDAWTCIDPSTESGACSTKKFEHELTLEVDMGAPTAPGMFVGMGAPPGMMGDGPAPSDTPTTTATASSPATTTSPAGTGAALPDDVAAFWVNELTQAQQALVAQRALLAQNSAAYAAFRAANGMPQYDAMPSAGDTPLATSAPLAYYASNFLWTQAAATAEQKTLQTCDMINGAIADALAGKRALYWDATNNDLCIASAPGDAYLIQMQANANGVKVPTYLDPTAAQPTGTMGAWPILGIIAVAATAIVVTLATVYAIGKVTDYLAQAHHDDMVATASSNVSAMVKAGLLTPAQGADYLAKTAGLANAGIIPPATPPASGSSFPWFTIGLGVAGGVVGTLLLEKAIAMFEFSNPLRRRDAAA